MAAMIPDCTELIHFLQVANEKEDLARELECSKSTLLKSCELFTHALQRAGLPGTQSNQYCVSEADGHIYRRSTDSIIIDMNEMDICCCKFIAGEIDDTMLKNICLERVETINKFDKPSQEELAVASDTRYLVLDNFSVCLNALKTAVLTACTVLRIGQVISNV